MAGRNLKSCEELLEIDLYPTSEELRALADELNLSVIDLLFFMVLNSRKSTVQRRRLLNGLLPGGVG